MKLKGVMPALVTPFDADAKVDFPALEKHMLSLRAAGVTGWVPCGSTGEYFSMSNKEREDVLRFVKDFASEDEVLIAGTNAPATREVIENTARAKGIGYDIVLLATPFYTRPTQDELLKHYRAVLDAVDVSLVLYNYPPKDGVEISFELMDALADHPRVIGIKESSGVLQRAVDIYSRYKGRIDLISGSDDIALDLMFWGADCWICGPANCMAKACCELDRTFRSGELDRAREQMAVLYRAMNILESGKFVQKIKYGCELQGTPVGECRAPLGPLTTEEKAEFKAAMAPVLSR
ncbi:dihydrodipicolinate synthase family protein [Mesorhizobium sp.]|uniref:dihydrodipicolinate synthase family protein n=1 Tax=Mesorhizobium sp. TaxID=1871066 RepID=UPI000FE72AF7|nr:dihydrodipicolinate synthase family protein [Mesorhizobium sp.]RWK60943.1 MAG: dihydrodipicolinate synthase family protein [Mesorhizobium sp.]RWM46547.1 MAG: dihydrodipicolinate synthase family protein [Mesorhizobium sp.]RWM50408.1 MAG: dihydrodipicolinate synthase family protein [Mesorhizobium sp.]RWM55483.1 MAG: dihydrodipicolinate synthase family protein [Mesorhizobium sp.]RWM95888.1 MAG: dihydrodipicolinate synthase family protein [Mesorhizobium sp.]